MLGWKFAFNNLILLFLTNNKKIEEIIFLQEYIKFPDIFLFFFLPIGFKISELLDFTVGIFISIVVQIIGMAMAIVFFIIENKIMILISLSIFNIGNTLNSLKLIQNSCKFYKKNFGLVFAVYLSSSSLCALIFTSFGKFMINQDETLLVNKYYLLISGVLTLFCGFFEMASSTAYDGYKNLKSTDSRSSSIDSNNISERFDSMVSDYNLTREKSYSTVVLYKINTKKVYFYKNNLQLIFIHICDFCKYILLNIYYI